MINMTLLDMSWFLMESKHVPVHGAFLHVFTPPEGAKADYPRRLLAAMKRRAVGAPFNLVPRLKLGALPFWEDVEVDAADHIVEHRLPSPGTDEQLMAASAEAMQKPLSWSVPLWRFHWFEGLSEGRFAFLLVAHHSQWDGMAFMRLLDETLSESPDSKRVRAPWQGVSTWLKPLRSAKSGKSSHAAPFAVMGALRGVAGAAMDVGKVFSQKGLQMLKGNGRVALPLSAPETRLERHGSADRVYAWAQFPVHQVKAIAKTSGCSFNDVMLTVIDAAYGNYVRDLGMAADKPLVALVPMALKVPGAGNQLSGAVVTLGSPEATMDARLRQISVSMGSAKADIASMSSTGAKLYVMILMGIAATPDLLRFGDHIPATANMIVSNPYGLPKRLFLNGSRLDYFVPVMGPSMGTRLMVGIWTYADQTFMSLASLRSVVPDIEHLATRVRQAFAELEREVLGPPTQPAQAKLKPARKPSARASTAIRRSVARSN